MSAILFLFSCAGICRPYDTSAARLLAKAKYFVDLYNWDAASPLFRRAEIEFEKSGDRRNAFYAHVGTLHLVSKLPLVQRSEELERLLKTNQLFHRDKALRLFTLIVKGDIDGELNQVDARADWTTVMQLATELNDEKWIYRAEGQLGLADYYDGDLASSQRRVSSALITATQNHDAGAQILFLSAIALGYQMQNLLVGQTMEYARQAIAIASSDPHLPRPKIAYSVLIRALAKSGRINEAEQLVDTLLSASTLTSVERFDYLSSAADAEVSADKVPAAIIYLKQAIAAADHFGAARELADLKSKLSGVYLGQGNLSDAEALARSACSSLKRLDAVPLLPAKMDSLAQVLVSERKYAEADAVFTEAEKLQDALIGKAGTLIAKTALITGADQLYSDHFALLVDRLNRPERAFEVIERARGRALVDLLMSKSSTSRRAVETEHTIARLQLKLKAANSPIQVENIRQEIFLAEQARAVNPDFTILGTRQLDPVPIGRIQRTLGSSEMLLEYVVAEPCSYVIVITADQISITKLTNGRSIAKLVSDYRVAVQRRTNAKTEARKLYDALLAPIPNREGKEIYNIVADGCLNLLPFDALINERNQYILESHIVSFVPSSTTLYLLRSKPLAAKNIGALLAVGNVPYAQDQSSTDGTRAGPRSRALINSKPEIDVAASAIKNSENVMLDGRSATETNLKEALKKQFGYIHLAVHAFSSDNPDRSSLVVLSDKANSEDGFLQASEILQMRIPSKLVVLSACDTNVGPVQGEAGISALSTAFLLAGARTVVSTLWPIEDQTSFALMKAFYVRAARGASGAEALTNAKRELLSTYGHDSLPVYWAGYLTQGTEPPQPR